MLVQLKIANYRSIYEEQTFSLVASKDKWHPGSLIHCDGFDLLKTAAIFGANASGKSNLVKAMSFMRELILTSATRMTLGDEIAGAEPFKLSKKTLNNPCRFEITFITEGVNYQYAFAADSERIHTEALFSMSKKGDKALWFDRSFDAQSKESTWKFGEPLHQHKDLLEERTRDNSLALSTAIRDNLKLLNPVFSWFRNSIQIIDRSKNSDLLSVSTARKCHTNEQIRLRVLSLMNDADLQIEGLQIEERDLLISLDSDSLAAESGIASLVTEIQTAFDGHSKKGLKTRQVYTQHKMIDSDDITRFELGDESNGTQRYFALLGPLLDALDGGSVVFIDEFESSLHPLLTRKLIELFQSPSANEKGAQLVFVSHDTNLLTPDLLRRDQIYIAEKLRGGGSEYFSLYDFKSNNRPRNNEAYERNYLEGRYGGVPQFNGVLEDLDNE